MSGVEASQAFYAFRGTAQGTLLYFFVYGCFLTFQSFSKFYLVYQKRKESKEKKISFRKVKYYNSDDTLALTGDRAVGNFIEFAILFLPLYWMHAVFVDPSQSFTIACFYSASRAIYPLVFPMKGMFVLCSTIPGYLVIFYLAGSVAYAVA